MKIFLSSETDLRADEIISPLRKQVSKKLDVLMTNKDEYYYGADVSVLCIISTCMEEIFLKDSNWKERVRYYQKDKYTDIRLNINYNKLLIASETEQYNLYLNNIIQSIEKFSIKYPKLDFKAKKLVDDIKYACKAEQI